MANRIIEAVKNFYTSGRGDVRLLKDSIRVFIDSVLENIGCFFAGSMMI